MKLIKGNGIPHLCLFSIGKIEVGQEITYNYGDGANPWRNKKQTSESEDGDDADNENFVIQLTVIVEKGEDGSASESESHNACVEVPKSMDEDGSSDDSYDSSPGSFLWGPY